MVSTGRKADRPMEVKTCTACYEEKPLDAFGWRNKGTPKEYQEARCKPCRSAANTAIKRRAREEAKEEITRVLEPTECPCDQCAKKMRCTEECLSFRCWVEYGV